MQPASTGSSRSLSSSDMLVRQRVPQTTNERLSRSPGPDISYFERIGFDRYNRFLTDISLP